MERNASAATFSSTKRRAELLQEDEQLTAKEQRLREELQRIDERRNTVRGELKEIDGRPRVPPTAFEGTNLSPAAQLWLADHGIKSRAILHHEIFTPGAFLSTLKHPTTDDLGVYDEVARYCMGVNPKWTKAKVNEIWEELKRKSGSVATPPEGTPL